MNLIALKANIEMISKEVARHVRKSKEQAYLEALELEWKFSAMVLDRLCLILFTVFTILSTVFILFKNFDIFMESDPDPKY